MRYELHSKQNDFSDAMNGVLGLDLAPRTRRVLQAVLYEVFAVALVTPLIAIFFDEGQGSALGLSVLMSSIALTWNYVFNALFEWWERRQTVKGRSPLRRLVHGIGFEGGLGVFLIPVMALWLDIALWQAVLAELGFLALFMVYTVAFTWCFDHLFGLPESARAVDAAGL
jgi:uncharacterized membrane protein